MSGNIFNAQMRLYQGKYKNSHRGEADISQIAFRYFRHMLLIFSSHPFYMRYICLPDAGDPIPHEICKNPKFWLYFKDAIGALDGSHIHSAPPGNERAANRNRKGFVSQNCLFGCSFDLKFIFTYTGWEGSATDALIYQSALLDGLEIPESKYYLADAGFPSCEQLLIPY